MSIKFTWAIEAREFAPEEELLKEVIKKIHWRSKGEYTDEQRTIIKDVYGVQELSKPDPNNYLAYIDITDEIIVAWLETLLPVEDYKKLIEDEIDKALNPKIILDINKDVKLIEHIEK